MSSRNVIIEHISINEIIYNITNLGILSSVTSSTSIGLFCVKDLKQGMIRINIAGLLLNLIYFPSIAIYINTPQHHNMLPDALTKF